MYLHGDRELRNWVEIRPQPYKIAFFLAGFISKSGEKCLAKVTTTIDKLQIFIDHTS